MAHYLVIVESPAKVKTIKKFLGKNYTVAASNGHVRDLPKSQLGIDVEHDYEPKYITIRGKGDILANLRKEAKKADKAANFFGCNQFFVSFFHSCPSPFFAQFSSLTRLVFPIYFCITGKVTGYFMTRLYTMHSLPSIFFL